MAATTIGRAEKICPPVARVADEAERQELFKHGKDRGALWRLEKDGRLSYLYAVVHLSKREWAVAGPGIVRALLDTEILALELNISDPAVQRGLSARTQPEPLVSPDLLERLRRQADKACVPWASLEPMPLAWTAVRLGLLAGRWDGLDGYYGIEWFLIGFARATYRPIFSLETVETQRRAIMGRSPEEQRTIIEDQVQGLEQDLQRGGIAAIAVAWADGDLTRLERFTEGADAERLLFDRNPGLAAGIATLHVGGLRVFAAIGILHTIGENGVPALLAQRGFKVERVPFATP